MPGWDLLYLTEYFTLVFIKIPHGKCRLGWLLLRQSQLINTYCCSFTVIICIGSGVDYNSGPYSVTFTAGKTSVSFDIALTDDNILEKNEFFNLTIDTPLLPNGFTVGSPGQAIVTIINNDSKLLIIVLKNVNFCT